MACLIDMISIYLSKGEQHSVDITNEKIVLSKYDITLNNHLEKSKDIKNGIFLLHNIVF